MPNANLKERVLNHITPIATAQQLQDHAEYTDDTIESQREYLKRLVVESSDNPLNEMDAIEVIRTIDSDSICPFIEAHLL